MKRVLSLAGAAATVSVLHRGADTIVRIGDRQRKAALRDLGDGAYVLTLDGRPHRIWLAKDGDRVFVHADGAAWTVDVEGSAGKAGGSRSAGADSAPAPMPGTVVSLSVKSGDAVKSGDTLMVIESMKLETSIKAWREGVVDTVHVEAGATFDKGAPLVTLAPEEGA